MSGGVSVKKVSKYYGALKVLDGIDLEVQPGEFAVLLGESGCGKSTLLRLISGLEDNHEGEIRIGGRDVTFLDPKDRKIAMVFQSYALYPHLSVYNNIAFGMQIRKTPKSEIESRVHKAAEILKLDQLLNRKPAQLSGGQRQRVAIGRALVRDPDVFLFDEPLSNLDAKLRGEMRVEIKSLHQRLGATIIYVTHDQIEAMTLADKIVLLNKGKIEQVGSPDDLYLEPKSLFAARFIGAPEINAVPVRVQRNAHGNIEAKANDSLFTLPENASEQRFDQPIDVLMAVRPEALRLGKEGGDCQTEGHKVELCEPTGSDTFMSLRFGDGNLRLRVPGMIHAKLGSEAAVAWDLAGARLFHPESGARL